MTLDEAKKECARWFDHHKLQDDASKKLQELAADRRAGRCTEKEGVARRNEIQGYRTAPTVYDGANLADAVRVLLKHVK